MKKYYYLLFTLLAVFSWQFLDIRLDQWHTASVGVSISSSVAHAQGATTGLPGYTGFLTSVLSNSSLPWFNELYGFSRGLLNIILLAFLVYIAFRNILNISVENYAIKKILPKIVFAAFLGNLIKPIMTIASKIVDSIILSQTTIFHTPASYSWSGGLHAGVGKTLLNILLTDVNSGATGIMALLGSALAVYLAIANWGLSLLVVIIIEGFILIGTLALGFFHSLAPWVVILATAVAPIAIGLSILPETESVFKKWTKIIIFWLAFPLILNAINYLFDLVPNITNVAADTSLMSKVISSLLPLLIKIGLFAFAIRMPFTWEKDVSGLVAAIPSQAAAGYKKGVAGAEALKKVPRALYERRRSMEASVGRRVTQESERGDFRARARTRFNSAEGQTRVRQGRIDEFRQRLTDNQGARNAIFGANTNMNNVTDAQLQQYYGRFRTGALRASAAPADQAAQGFFTANDQQVRTGAEGRAMIEYEAEARGNREQELGNELRGVDANGNRVPVGFRNGAWRSAMYRGLGWAEAGPTSFIPGLARASIETAESNTKEEDKVIRRTSWAFRRTGSRYARGKSEVERISSDVAHAEKSQDLDIYNGLFANLRNNIERSMFSANDPLKRQKASAYMANLLNTLKNTDENMPGYDRAFAGLRANWNQTGNGVAFRANAPGIEDNINAVKAVYDRLAVLLSRESRATVDPELQIARTNRRISDYVINAGAPSGSVGGAGGNNGGRDDDDFAGLGAPSQATGTPEDNEQIAAGLSGISQELKAVNNSVQGVRQQIKTTTGVPLQRMSSLLGRQGASGLSNDELEEMTAQTEFGLGNIAEILTRKDPAKADSARKYAQDLEGTSGLATPEILAQIKQEFYPNEDIDPQLLQSIEIPTSNEVTVLGNQMQSEQNHIILDRANAIASDPATRTQVLQSIQVINNNAAKPNTVAPQALQQAQQTITTHTGLPKDTPLTPKMVNDIHRALQAGMTNDPLHE